jgi:hypothetical protein
LFGCSEGKHGKQITEKKPKQIEQFKEKELEDKERIREEERIEINERNIEKFESTYEEKFKRPAPRWGDFSREEYSNVEYIKYLRNRVRCLQRAFSLEIPYNTTEEEVIIKSKSEEFETEYKKMFGTPITNSELLTERVHFNVSGYGSGLNSTHVLVARTITGAIVRYRQYWNTEWLETKLSTREWLYFIRTLYKCINEWERFYDSDALDGEQWIFEILPLDKDGYINDIDKFTFSGSNAYPSNWDEFMKIIDDITAKTKIKEKENTN